MQLTNPTPKLSEIIAKYPVQPVSPKSAIWLLLGVVVVAILNYGNQTSNEGWQNVAFLVILAWNLFYSVIFSLALYALSALGQSIDEEIEKLLNNGKFFAKPLLPRWARYSLMILFALNLAYYGWWGLATWTWVTIFLTFVVEGFVVRSSKEYFLAKDPTWTGEVKS